MLIMVIFLSQNYLIRLPQAKKANKTVLVKNRVLCYNIYNILLYMRITSPHERAGAFAYE